LEVLAMPMDDFVRIHGESARPLTERTNPFDVIRHAYLHGANSVRKV
jgi:hypothetical protein